MRGRWPGGVVVRSALALAGLGLALQPQPVPPPTPVSGRHVLGYYVPYDPTAWASLEAHPESIDAVAPQWVTIDACGNLGSRDDQTLKRFAHAHGMQVFPSLLTSSGWLNHQLLDDPEVAAHAAEQIVAYVAAEGYDGFDLDLEGVNADDRDALSAFVTQLAPALHAPGKLLTLAVPPKAQDVTTGWAGPYDYAALGEAADLVTIMTYEAHGTWSGPGSVAPYDWVDRVMAFATSQIPAQKVRLGLAFYGYDWNVTSGSARALGYAQAAELAERYGAPIGLDPATRSGTFRYQALAGDPPPASAGLPRLQHVITRRDPPPCSVEVPAPAPPPPPAAPPPAAIQEHEVWIEESAGAAQRLDLVDVHGTGGVAAWRLGQEDPRVWDVLSGWRADRP